MGLLTDLRRGSTSSLLTPTLPSLIGAAPFSPLDIDWDTLFWADDITGLVDSDPVATWSDSSGNAHDATQATAAKRPIYRAALAGFNGRAVVEFDGVDDWLATAAFTAVASGEVAVIVQRTGASTDQQSYFSGIGATNRWNIGSRLGGTSNRFIFQGAAKAAGSEDGAKHYLRGDFDATDRLHFDGTQVFSGDAGSETLTGVRLGAHQDGAAQFFSGHLALLGFKASPLTPTEQENMLAWSRSYYGTP